MGESNHRNVGVGGGVSESGESGESSGSGGSGGSGGGGGSSSVGGGGVDAALDELAGAIAEPPPLIVHEPTQAWAESVPEHVVEAARTAQLARAMGSESEPQQEGEGEGRPRASVPEGLVYCFTASMDARVALNREFVAVYERLFERYLAEEVPGGAEGERSEMPGIPGTIGGGSGDSVSASRADELAEDLLVFIRDAQVDARQAGGESAGGGRVAEASGDGSEGGSDRAVQRTFDAFESDEATSV